jgi:hypothetical protein
MAAEANSKQDSSFQVQCGTTREVVNRAQEVTMPFACKIISQARIPRVLATLVLLAAALLLPSSTVFGQQTYVTRFDAFAGYTFLDSSNVDLFENGAHFQFGVRPKTWYSVGFDYSISAGNLTLTPDLLTTTLQQQLGAELPPGYNLSVASHSRTQTFALGPQLAFRHYSKLTLFLRPDLGAMYERATPHPTDEISGLVVAQLAPPGYKTSWAAFYGFGGGADLLFSRHVAVRVQADLVYVDLFSDLLKSGRFTTRFSIGPCFNFGKNIAK